MKKTRARLPRSPPRLFRHLGPRSAMTPSLRIDIERTPCPDVAGRRLVSLANHTRPGWPRGSNVRWRWAGNPADQRVSDALQLRIVPNRFDAIYAKTFRLTANQIARRCLVISKN